VHDEVVGEAAAMVMVIAASLWLLEASLLEGSLLPLSEEPLTPLVDVGPSLPPAAGGLEDDISSLYSTAGPGSGYTVLLFSGV